MENVLVFCNNAEAFQRMQVMLKCMDCSNIEQVPDEYWLSSYLQRPRWDMVFFNSFIQTTSLQQVSQELLERDANLPIVVVGDGPQLRNMSRSEKLPNICYQMPAAPQIQHLHYALNSAALYRQNGFNPMLGGEQRGSRAIVGTSPSMKALRALIRRIAPTDSGVLILGESGTGKELVARNIHACSKRQARPFVPLNCGAIPENLLESELFGHEKGAFTGAITTRKGRFELAEGGTLFLDEIGDMPPDMQVKLLRVLEEREFEPLGSSRTIKVDVRVIAATHRNLEDRIRDGLFREDLFYRLNILPIEIPSLREHASDIPSLIHEMLRRASKVGRGSVQLTSGAINSLLEYPWPGNIRELANLIERLTVLHPYSTVDISKLPENYRGWAAQKATQADSVSELSIDSNELTHLTKKAKAKHPDDVTTFSFPADGLNLRDYLAKQEKNIITSALEANNFIVAKTARALKINRTTLIEKMRKLGIKQPTGN